mmetsp:Transcript_20386/g.44142  ORF Transcript_20386/g.44142 Transcript_20386/m.44142 type:complete len:307 (-) Transcript_20386:166-1086(-)
MHHERGRRSTISAISANIAPTTHPTPIPPRRVIHHSYHHHCSSNEEEEKTETTRRQPHPHRRHQQRKARPRQGRQQNTTRCIHHGKECHSRMGQVNLQYQNIHRQHPQAANSTPASRQKTKESQIMLQKAGRRMPHLLVGIAQEQQRGGHGPTPQGVPRPPRLHENGRLLPPTRRQGSRIQRPKGRKGLQKVPQRRQVPLLPPRMRKKQGNARRRRTPRKVRRHGIALDTTLAGVSVGFVRVVPIAYGGGASEGRGVRGVRRAPVAVSRVGVEEGLSGVVGADAGEACFHRQVRRDRGGGIGRGVR